MSPSEEGKTVLLTGAGFTHNFGGFLAEGIWSLIFNHKLIDNKPNVKEKLRNQFDYERIYNDVINGDYTPDEKEAVKKVIREAYVRLDENTRETLRGNNRVNELIERFSGEMRGSGFFFTLNQDLYIERHFGSTKTKLSIPDLDNRIWGIRDRPFTDDYYVRLTGNLDSPKEPLSATKFHYIKLHGSLNWKKSDGTDALVIGTYKVFQIEQEPLLNWYFKIFKEELSKGERKLLSIGYGFGDEHINAIIIDSMKNHGLKLYVISPSKAKEFKNELCSHQGEPIWDRLSGYYPHMLTEVLENLNIWYDIIKTIFED